MRQLYMVYGKSTSSSEHSCSLLSTLDVVMFFASSIIPKTMTCHKFSMEKL